MGPYLNHAEPDSYSLSLLHRYALNECPRVYDDATLERQI
jgi:hypothetical protein